MSETITDRKHVHSTQSPNSPERPVTTAPTPSRTVADRVAGATLFWLLCLTLTAAGHRLYKATVAADRTISATTYQTDGMPITWVGNGSVDDATQRLAPDVRPTDVSLVTTLPVSWFLLCVAAGFTLAGGFLAWSGRWIGNTGMQSLVGVFAGHFLWLGAIEFGLEAAGRRIGLARSVAVVEGRVVGTHGGGILIQLSVVFLVPVLIGLTLHESNRCAVFQWFRRRLPILPTASASGRVENYAARTAIQYFMTVWFCYVSVLWLADSRLGSLGQMGLLLTLFVIAVATPYMVWRTVCQPGDSNALRYSVSGAVVTWTGIEIAAAMRYFHEPWLSDSVSSGLILLGLTILLTGFASRTLVGRRFRFAGARLGTTLVLAVVALGINGCHRTNTEAELSAAEFEKRLRDYDARIQKPETASRDGLLHALESADPAMRAQAALAFGKADRVGHLVRKRLYSMAADDDSRLAQFAALAALHRHERDSRELQRILNGFRKDPQWRSVAEYVKNRTETLPRHTVTPGRK